MKYVLVIIGLVFTWSVQAQKKIDLHGTVLSYIDGQTTTPVYGAKVFFKNAKAGTLTDETGFFMIHGKVSFPDTLIVRASGYYPDTIPYEKWDSRDVEIILFPEYVAEEVVIRAKRSNSTFLRLDPRDVERLGEGELKKMACCNLAESFETNATVDVSLADGVSGSKRIKMMGVSGRYTQLQFENIPFMQNLDQAFGLESIPGTWIHSIQITKGTGTVVNGYESMVGAINLSYKIPDQMNRLYVNGYGDLMGRGELNVQGGAILNEKWSSSWFIHGSGVFKENDRNNDGFRDVPLGNKLIGMTRWEYKTHDFKSKFGVKAGYIDKQGGEIGFQRNATNKENLYGVGIRNLNIEAFGKTGFLLGNDRNSMGIIYYAKYDELNTIFGNRTLDAVEKRGYINAIYQGMLGSTNHVLKAGLSLVYDDLDQVMEDQLPTDTSTRVLDRTEIVPGAFAEYTYTGLRNTIVAGARLDYHNLYSWQFDPRVNYKFNITEDLALRLTAGRGFRVSNYAVDHLSLMATNTPWIVEDNIQPEISWNFGGGLRWNFQLFERDAIWSADFYHTLFQNQLIADREESSAYIHMKNLEGQSFSNAFQVDFRFEPISHFVVKLAYKWLDVQSTMGGELQSDLMIPKHRGFVNLEYETKNTNWRFDATFSVFGMQRLAKVRLPDGTVTTDNTADPFPMLSAQVTYHFKKFEIYLGGENLLDQRLKNPIIDASHPQSAYFDATRVYKSIFGANVYLGFRFELERKKEHSSHGVNPPSEKGSGMNMEGDMKTSALYVCPMHPDITSNHPGECSKCGMDLVKKTPEGMKK